MVLANTPRLTAVPNAPDEPAPEPVSIVVRYPDWVTCRQWIVGRGPCGAINLLGENFPITCVRCRRAF